ncbi:MAG: hypothetical protein NTV00_16440 [Methylococcales bacterium]|nr:hypothetical protein [Methylococcales bacterium]
MNSIKKMAVLLLLSLVTTSGMAYQVTIKDVSEKPDFSAKEPSGEHPIFGYSSLMVSVTLDAGEKEELLDNVHVIAEQQGKFYQLQQTGMWEPIAFNGLLTSVPLIRSFQRAPWNMNKVTVEQQVVLYALYTKGTKVYVAARANDTAGFVEGSVKAAFVVQ